MLELLENMEKVFKIPFLSNTKEQRDEKLQRLMTSFMNNGCMLLSKQNKMDLKWNETGLRSMSVCLSDGLSLCLCEKDYVLGWNHKEAENEIKSI